MGRTRRKSLLAVALLTLLSFQAAAQAMPAAEQTEIVEKVIAELREKYPFPEVTKKMEAALRAKLRGGAYAGFQPGEFGMRVTHELQTISGDRHISLDYTPEKLTVKPLKIESIYAPAEALPRAEEQSRSRNYGTTEVRVLEGNVGYIRFHHLSPLEFAGETYAAAMRYITNTEALIFDLRECGGATSPDVAPFFAGYLFEHPVHMSNMFIGSDPKPRQFWSQAHVPGPKYLKKPVYVLTSRSTFSGGEAFAYELQALKRATVIGEVTGGGGNPNAVYPIAEHFNFSVPFARVENPVTKSNWQDRGVKPDVATSRAEAFQRGHEMAITALKAKAPAEAAAHFDELLDNVRAAAPRLEKVTFRLPGHAQAKSVSVMAHFNGFTPWANPLEKTADGWTTTVEVEKGRYWYIFMVDGQYVLDPGNPMMNRDKRANVLLVK